MNQPNRPRIVRDSRGQTKLKISLPGGRYQLSLDDRGENLLFDTLGYDLRDTVPDLVVRVLIATGDAWFPHQRDSENVIADLPTTSAVEEPELDALASYLRTNRVPRSNVDLVRTTVTETALASRLEPAEIDPQNLPDFPTDVFGPKGFETETETERETSDRETTAEQSNSADPASSKPQRDVHDKRPDSVAPVAAELSTQLGASRRQVERRLERLVANEVSLDDARRIVKRQFSESGPDHDVFDIPGVGTTRGSSLIDAGLDSVAELATTRPAELADLPGLSPGLATTIVEGARELVGDEDPTAARLSDQTGVPETTFANALSQLAAAGIPPSAAAPTLRRLYGPSITQLDAIDGQIAYFLWEAGYATPWELAHATTDELEAADYVGSATAEQIIDEAASLVDTY